MSEYIVAIDQGTSSCRAVLVSAKGKIVGIAQEEFTQIFPESDWVEHDPMEIWTVQMRVFEKVVDENKVDSQDIKAIGITNQRETTVVWDKHTGQPVYNAIVWQDKRTSEFCRELKAEGFEKYVRSRTGLPIDPYFSGTKVKWILDKVGRSDNLLFGTIDTWLIWNLTQGAVHATDHTNASRTLLYDISNKQWDKKILDRFGISEELLPDVQNSASHFGGFSFRGVTIPITGVAGDQQAALFGQACFEEGSAKNTYGTGCFMLMNVGDEFVSSENGLLTTLCCNEKGEPAYALEGSIFVAGAAIQWLRDGLKIISDSKETEEMAVSVKEDESVIVVPAFAGLGAPYWDMDARGAIYGLTRATTSAHIAKATLEAIAFRTKDVLTAMEKDGKMQLEILKVDGGAALNNYLMQFQADILGVKVVRPKNTETTAMGAAYLAGLSIGMWKPEDLSQLSSVDNVFKRIMPEEKVDARYATWEKMVERTLTTDG